MNTETWQKLDELFSKYPFMKAESVDEKEISNAESRLGFTFDSDYKDFVRKYGGAIVGAYPIFGLRHAEPMDDYQWSVIDVTKSYKDEEWEGVDDWYIVSADHAGNPIGLTKEGSVYRLDHDIGIVEKMADSFEEYILSCLGA